MSDELRGAEKDIFRVIKSARTRQLSGYYIALLTGYSPKTVYRSLRKLERRGLIERNREMAGQTYQISVCGKQSEAA